MGPAGGGDLRGPTGAGKGHYDIYVVFVERALRLLNARGRLGFILPHKFFNAQYGEPLRALLADGKHLAEVVHFGDQQVFAGATTYTCLLFLDRAGRRRVPLRRGGRSGRWREARAVDPKGFADLAGSQTPIPATDTTAAEWNFTVGASDLFEKLRGHAVKLGDVADKISPRSWLPVLTRCIFFDPLAIQGGEGVTGRSNATGKRIRSRDTGDSALV